MGEKQFLPYSLIINNVERMKELENQHFSTKIIINQQETAIDVKTNQWMWAEGQDFTVSKFLLRKSLPVPKCKKHRAFIVDKPQRHHLI